MHIFGPILPTSPVSLDPYAWFKWIGKIIVILGGGALLRNALPNEPSGPHVNTLTLQSLIFYLNSYNYLTSQKDRYGHDLRPSIDQSIAVLSQDRNSQTLFSIALNQVDSQAREMIHEVLNISRNFGTI